MVDSTHACTEAIGRDPETVAVAVADPVLSGIETAALLYEAKVFAELDRGERVDARTTPFRSP